MREFQVRVRLAGMPEKQGHRPLPLPSALSIGCKRECKPLIFQRFWVSAVLWAAGTHLYPSLDLELKASVFASQVMPQSQYLTDTLPKSSWRSTRSLRTLWYLLLVRALKCIPRRVCVCELSEHSPTYLPPHLTLLSTDSLSRSCSWNTCTCHPTVDWRRRALLPSQYFHVQFKQFPSKWCLKYMLARSTRYRL